MSNYDAGHYFLTLFAPIRLGHRANDDSSHVTGLRLDLRSAPTARQDSVTRDAPQLSAFANVPGVHFARVFILDQLTYNGRKPTNAVVNLLRNVNLVKPETIDQFEHAWLVVALDLDAPDGSESSLRACSDRLWQGMEPELRRIFGHCLGFDDKTIRTASDWFDYLRRCQVTTTMPFNDYWTGAPPPSPLVRYIGVAAVAIAGLAVAASVSGFWPFGWFGLLASALLLWVLVIIGLVLRLGTTPFAAAPDSDLTSVLKALHIQQRFSRLALAERGADAASLHRAFGDFITAERPSDLSGPAQPAGCLPPTTAKAATP
jgi:hypothetical protein